MLIIFNLVIFSKKYNFVYIFFHKIFYDYFFFVSHQEYEILICYYSYLLFLFSN